MFSEEFFVGSDARPRVPAPSVNRVVERLPSFPFSYELPDSPGPAGASPHQQPIERGRNGSASRGERDVLTNFC